MVVLFFFGCGLSLASYWTGMAAMIWNRPRLLLPAWTGTLVAVIITLVTSGAVFE
jgi:hypothetical protein